MKQQSHRVMALLLALLLPLVLMESSASAQQPVSTAFTYQGQLKRDGGTFTGDCAFRFGLWNAETGGTELAAQPLPAVTVRNGIFTVQLDFGADPNHFTGDARWLEVAVQCQGDANPTIMTPRILLTSSPYAIGLMPGAQIIGKGNGAFGVVRVVNTAEGPAILGLAAPSTGVTYGIVGNAFSPNGIAVSGYTENGGTAVSGLANDGGYGIYGTSGTKADMFNTIGSNAGVFGTSSANVGVYGTSDTSFGLYGQSNANIGVIGESMQFQGVRGIAHNPGHGAVVGEHRGGGIGVFGGSASGAGVTGNSVSWIGVYGESTQNEGVRGVSHSSGFGGVVGFNDGGGIAVYGNSTTGDAIWGTTSAANKAGIVGINTGGGLGIYANSANGDGISGTTNAGNKAGVVAINNGNGNGLYARSNGGGFAGFFDGKVASKSVHILGGADLAEWYNVSGAAAPGTLMVIDPAHPGQLMPSNGAYDTRVAGVVSGAGGVNPGLTLQQEGVLDGDTQVAIAGRVYVQAEALSSPIQPGDLLTTSDIPGHAMKAVDRDLAYGAVIGKAMTGLEGGTGLVLVLVNLQ